MNVEDILKQYESIKGDRGNWESQWQEVADRVLPRHAIFTTSRSPGQKNREYIFDSAPCIALERFASVIDSLLTPRNTKWHNLKTTDEYINKDWQVRQYFDEVNQLLFNMRYQPKSNFSSQNHERWTSMGAFGTGILFTDWADDGFRYKHLSLANTYICDNHQGVVDTVYRKLMLTARQAVQKFGTKMLPDKIKEIANEPGQYKRKFEFIHAIMPNNEYMPGKLDHRGKQFASLYIALEERQMVTEPSGYSEFPFSISRYLQAPDEVYGRGPAIISLPDIKMLNEMAKTDIRAVHKLVDPPLLLHDDGILGGGGATVNLRPGGLNFGGVSRDGRQLIQPLVTNARVDINEQKMQQRRDSINDSFLVTLFQILVENPRMTATEALIRANEKAMLLTPTAGRQQSEALGPLINRELQLLAENGVLPDMPEALLEAEGEYEVTYESPMNRMQRAEELVGVQRTFELLTPFAQIDPSVLDIFDPDELAQLTAEVSGVPMKVLRSPQALSDLRQQRAEQQAAEQEAIMTAQLAPAMKDVAQAQALSRQ